MPSTIEKQPGPDPRRESAVSADGDVMATFDAMMVPTPPKGEKAKSRHDPLNFRDLPESSAEQAFRLQRVVKSWRAHHERTCQDGFSAMAGAASWLRVSGFLCDRRAPAR